MGLSSSQGRLLMLTSRMSDIELSEIMISQRQNRLAWEQSKAAEEYNAALSNYKLTIKVDDAKQDLNYSNLTNAGYFVVNDKREIYLKKNEDGSWDIPTDLEGNPTLEIKDGKATYLKGGLVGEFNVVDGTDLLSNAETLQNCLMNGRLYIANPEKSQPALDMAMLASETTIEYVLDTSDDAQAESKYEAETARVSREDNQYDMQMQQLETQHEAILKEYDSVKKVISNNVDRTFNLFSDG